MSTTAKPGSIGAGQQDPFDSSSEFTVAAFIVRQIVSLLDTMKLVKVVAVHGGGLTARPGTVDVQLLVNQVDGAGNATPHGIVYGVPWLRVQGGTGAFVVDPVVGDVGYVVVSDRDISSVKSAAENDKDPQVNPGSLRKYNVADGVYVGALFGKAPTQYVAIIEGGIKIADKSGNVVELTTSGVKVTDKTGNVIEGSSAGIVLTPSGSLPVKVVGNLVVTGNIQLGGTVLAQAGGTYGGNISTSGDFVAGTISLKTHTHTQPNDSHGDSESPTNAPS